MKHLKKALILSLAGLWASSAAAQTDCPTIVQSALDATDAVCEGTGRNQACYGNIQLEAIPQEELVDFNFDQPGDIVDVAGVQTLTLEPLDAAADIWGVALMRIQANLPDTMPGQNVTFLLFGDVEIRNAVETNVEPVTFNVTATGNINVRSGPSTNQERIGGLSNSQVVTADGRIEDGSWLRIQLPDGGAGWVSADLVTPDGDIRLLNVVDPNAAPEPPLNPMQAFYFQSGIGDAPCAEAPDSGILIQTPQGVGQISLRVNEVDIQLGSTAYLQAQAGGEMTVNVVENQATVSAQGATRFVPAGSRVRVPLDENLAAAGPPSEPEPYNNADLAALPVDRMPRAVQVHPALSVEELEALAANTLPTSGQWLYTSGSATIGGDCASFMDASMIPQVSEVITLEGLFTLGPSTSLPTLNVPELGSLEFANPEPGLFVTELSTEGISLRYEIRVISPTLLEGLSIMDSAEGGFTCTVTIPFTMEKVGD